jgi:hypothetical protein
MKFKITLAAVASALALCAADAWKNTDYTQWSPEEAKKILSKSPWSKEVSVITGAPGGGQQSGGRGGGRRGGGGGGDTGEGGLTGGTGGRGGSSAGEGGAGGNGTPSMNLIVRWETAIPVKEALMKLNFGDHLPAKGEKGYTLDAPQNNYIISVTGLRLGGGGRGRGAQEQEAAGGQQSAADRMKDQLMTGTTLVRKGKDPIVPANIVVNSKSNVVFFVFPKTDVISEDDKDVEFRMALGRIQVKEKFSLKEMHFSGKLEL